MRRTLQNGKSLQFIFSGRTQAEYHTPGNSILGNSDSAPPVAEKTVTVDDLLISSAFVYELDETLSHYDLRGEISRKIGYALAEQYDRKIFRAITKAARQASPITKTNFKEPGGTQIRLTRSGVTDGTAAYDSTCLINGFYDAAAALDEKGVSQDGRVAVLNPRQYYELIQNVETNGLINRNERGDSLQSGNGIIEIAGIQIFKSMNIPFFGRFGTKFGTASNTNPGVTDPGGGGDFVEVEMVDETAGTTTTKTVNNYGNGTSAFENSCGLIFQKESAACVEAIGPQVQVTSGDISVVYQGDVILGRLAMGADALNPAAAVELVAGVATSRNAAGESTTVGNAAF
tara:strand:- start:3089 stop:4123 length:1035 start_codon:yes stop_codon:yes gene_type:complete